MPGLTNKQIKDKISQLSKRGGLKLDAIAQSELFAMLTTSDALHRAADTAVLSAHKMIRFKLKRKFSETEREALSKLMILCMTLGVAIGAEPVGEAPMAEIAERLDG